MNSKDLPTIGGVRLTHTDLETAITEVTKRVTQKRYNQPLTVFTPNTEQIMQTKEQPAFLEVLNAAGVTVPDTIGLVVADWWRAFTTGQPWRVRERVAGVDLAEKLLSEAAKAGWKVVLVGGIDDSSQVAVDNLKKRFSGLGIWRIRIGRIVVSGQLSVVGGENKMDVTMENEGEVIRQINQLKPDLVLVGLGAPKQEVWVMKYGGKLTTQVLMVVGGAIDMWSGVQTRAPRWMRSWGLEWLWRLVQQPWRIGRQLRLVKFGWLVVRGKI